MNTFEYLTAFTLAFIVSFSATPIARKVAFKLGAIDIPGERKMHTKPIALMGGLAIIAGFLSSILFDTAGNLFGSPGLIVIDKTFLGVISGLLIIVIMGMLDDIYTLKPRIKLIFQVAAGVVVVSTGTLIEGITNPFAGGTIQLAEYKFISYPLTILWIVGVTNAINLIDGLDGLAAGVSSISALSLFVVSIIIGEPIVAVSISILTAALAGATLGFLPYNFNPAKIFMGETGSASLGFVLGVLSIQGFLKAYTAIAVAVPLLVLGLPLFDTVFAIIRRLANKKPISKGDSGHLHHRLLQMGLSQRQSVFVLYTVSAVLGLCAIVLADKGTIKAIFLIAIVAGFVFTGIKYMSVIESEEQIPQSKRKKIDNVLKTEVKEAKE